LLATANIFVRARRRATWRVRAQYTVQTSHVRCNLQRSRSFYAPSAVIVDKFSMNDDFAKLQQLLLSFCLIHQTKRKKLRVTVRIPKSKKCKKNYVFDRDFQKKVLLEAVFYFLSLFFFNLFIKLQCMYWYILLVKTKNYYIQVRPKKTPQVISPLLWLDLNKTKIEINHFETTISTIHIIIFSKSHSRSEDSQLCFFK
jgi:hypothetical protein